MTIDLQLSRAFARELPDALRPSWLEETWNGAFGSEGIQAAVRQTDVTANLDRSAGVSGHADALGRLSLGFRQLGAFGREVTLEPSGRLAVQHNLIKLEAMQGTGFSRAFNDHAVERYAAAGVERITAAPGLEVGGYAWARQGFELLAPGATDAARTRFRGERLAGIVDTARAEGRISHSEYRELDQRLVRPGTEPQEPLTSIQELAAIPDVGKRALLGSEWKGERPIERAATWWGAAPASDATAGAASVQVARRAAAQLPAALDPFRAPQVFERHLAARGIDASIEAGERANRASVRLADGSIISGTGSYRLAAEGDRIDLAANWTRTTDGVEGSATVGAMADSTDLRHALDDAWRELGAVPT